MKITEYPEYKTEVYEFPPHNRTLKVFCTRREPYEELIFKYQYVKLHYINFIFIYNNYGCIEFFKLCFTDSSLNHFGNNEFQYALSSSCLGEWDATNDPLDWITRFWQTSFEKTCVNNYLTRPKFRDSVNIKLLFLSLWSQKSFYNRNLPKRKKNFFGNSIRYMQFYSTLKPIKPFECNEFISGLGQDVCLGYWNPTSNPIDWITRFWQTDFHGCYLASYAMGLTSYGNLDLKFKFYLKYPEKIHMANLTDDEYIRLINNCRICYKFIKNPSYKVRRYYKSLKN